MATRGRTTQLPGATRAVRSLPAPPRREARVLYALAPRAAGESLRSLTVGDCDHYQSPYMTGVAEAMARLGHEHREVSVRRPLAEVARALREARPHVVWTHMLLWPPPGAPPVGDLVSLMEDARRAGAAVVLHDGDYKERTRHPEDLSSWCSVALLNHGFDRSAWRVPTVWWPYFARTQDRIADFDKRWACELFFAGKLDRGPVYAERTAFVERVAATGVSIRIPTEEEGNTLLETPAVAASADAVLGFGRPGVRGWLDVRVFQYPGAGGVLLHDDVGGCLEPWVHYVPYSSGDAASVADALARLKVMTDADRRALRERAHAYVQERHSSVARVRQVIAALELA